MQRPVYVKFEYRDNMGYPIKTLERIAIIEDQGDNKSFADTLADWAADTARAMATVIVLTKADIKKARQEQIKRLVAND